MRSIKSLSNIKALSINSNYLVCLTGAVAFMCKDPFGKKKSTILLMLNPHVAPINVSRKQSKKLMAPRVRKSILVSGVAVQLQLASGCM